MRIMRDQRDEALLGQSLSEGAVEALGVARGMAVIGVQHQNARRGRSIRRQKQSGLVGAAVLARERDVLTFLGEGRDNFRRQDAK